MEQLFDHFASKKSALHFIGHHGNHRLPLGGDAVDDAQNE